MNKKAYEVAIHLDGSYNGLGPSIAGYAENFIIRDDGVLEHVIPVSAVLKEAPISALPPEAPPAMRYLDHTLKSPRLRAILEEAKEEVLKKAGHARRA